MIGYVIRGEEEAKKWYDKQMYVKEAAEYLGLSKYLVRKMVKENKIPYTKSYRDISFHKAILDSWMRGDFIPGRVALILDDECIEYDLRDALSEHYRRYPELVEMKHEISLTLPNDNYHIEVRDDGVSISIKSASGSVSSQMFLNNQVIDHLLHIVKAKRSPE
ncbi:excisionase family DNA-binding protein [Paenibacillus glucanolyticus]|uniref:excisionase family DNA-binding protein n=1 Tax=Paenibacillus glucanolyticus TaxID=59843 RepID=UPI00128B982E|nr:helix-turn-helix domain-containing protein [Paenibacillus glucanolyticus]MCA4751105.1 excisionase family DNA-binding protein [Mycolicibacterium fortuitum]MPY17500.1 helix-turn-helix domain-containing protein [Paenibacillus glucanolyticus]